MVKHHENGRVSMTKKEFDRMKTRANGGHSMKVGKRGTKSKTHSGLNFETRKDSKMFDRDHHREDHAEGSRRRRRPY